MFVALRLCNIAFSTMASLSASTWSVVHCGASEGSIVANPVNSPRIAIIRCPASKVKLAGLDPSNRLIASSVDSGASSSCSSSS